MYPDPGRVILPSCTKHRSPGVLQTHPNPLGESHGGSRRGPEIHPGGTGNAEPGKDTAVTWGGLGGSPEMGLRVQTLSQAAPGIKSHSPAG